MTASSRVGGRGRRRGNIGFGRARERQDSRRTDTRVLTTSAPASEWASKGRRLRTAQSVFKVFPYAQFESVEDPIATSDRCIVVATCYRTTAHSMSCGEPLRTIRALPTYRSFAPMSKGDNAAETSWMKDH